MRELLTPRRGSTLFVPRIKRRGAQKAPGPPTPTLLLCTLGISPAKAGGVNNGMGSVHGAFGVPAGPCVDVKVERAQG